MPNSALIRPFVAHAPQAVLDDLKARLRNTRWPAAPAEVGWADGTNLEVLRELATYWEQEFDWRRVEAQINAFPNFTTEINGQNIHFLHIKGEGPNPVPLLITHGWPGSFLEMLKLIPLLSAAGAMCFDVVIPSLVGFGYSAPCAAAGGCDAEMVADLWHQLMQRLGYERYGAQGGDVGAGVSSWLGLKYPASVIGVHLNYIPGSYRPFLAAGEAPSPEAVAFQQVRQDWAAREGAYIALHATKPLTAAYGLNDSPVGLCAWLLEKFYAWSDPRQQFTPDELLANVTLYWVTQSIYSSMAIYKANARHPLQLGLGEYIGVPVGFAQFPYELPTPPRAYLEKGFNIQHWTAMPTGGHFAALEEPALLAADVQAFFQSIV